MFFLYLSRWLREVHRAKDVQQEPEDTAGYRRVERGFHPVLSHGRLQGEKEGVRQERYQGQPQFSHEL